MLPVRAIWSCSTLSRSRRVAVAAPALPIPGARATADFGDPQIENPRLAKTGEITDDVDREGDGQREVTARDQERFRSEEHTSELQSRFDLVCRLLLEKKKNIIKKKNI